MEMVAHDPAAAHRLGVPQSVGREFVEADRGRKFAAGGIPGLSSKEAPPMAAAAHSLAGPHNGPVSGFKMPHLPHAEAMPMHIEGLSGMGGGLRSGFAMGGDPMGIPYGEADPYWTRQAMRGEDAVHPGGLITGSTAGRADHVPTAVAANSYILPADVVSGLGEGNTLNGQAQIDKMLHSEPYGIAPPQMHGRSSGFAGMPRPPAPANDQYAYGGNVIDFERARRAMQTPGFSLQGMHSGRVPHGEGTVPVRLSDGEYNIRPEFVAKIGSGSYDRGHAILDAFVKLVRENVIKKLKSLPGPKKGDE